MMTANVTTAVFEDLYLRVRRAEGRLYSDEELVGLPFVPATHRYSGEWKLRAASSQRLVDYIKRKPRPVEVLEVGCGNGWLSRKIACIPGVHVVGIDVNQTELEQASRVFRQVGNLVFEHAENFRRANPVAAFDLILFSASIQYFHSIRDALQQYAGYLRDGGEIHILDSPFYSNAGAEKARSRTKRYYEEHGFPEMCRHYFHHSLEELKGYHHRVLYNPRNIWHRLTGSGSPFPWIRVEAIHL